MPRWLRAELGSRSRANRRTRRQRFDASALAAAAKRAMIVDAHVSTFAGGTSIAMVDAAVEHNAGANAGSDRGIENVIESAGRAPSSFREGGGVCVIIHFHGDAILGGDPVSQGKVPPA